MGGGWGDAAPYIYIYVCVLETQVSKACGRGTKKSKGGKPKIIAVVLGKLANVSLLLQFPFSQLNIDAMSWRTPASGSSAKICESGFPGSPCLSCKPIGSLSFRMST